MVSNALAVFDLDGTLVETGPDLAGSCDHVLRAAGLPGIDVARLRPHIGFGARRMLTAAMDENGTPYDSALLDRLFDAFLVHYESRIAELSRPFDEMLAALDTLERAGVGAAVCTNKREGLARKLLGALGLSDRLAAIVGGDTCGVAKPDPTPLLHAIEAAGGARESSVFVGDSRVDRETARNAGVPFVGVTYGYTDVPMEALEPDRLCRPGEDVGAAILHCAGLAAPPLRA